MYSLGFDIGSSSVKAALLDVENGKIVGTSQYPETEMPISAPKSGWAEQEPEDWWNSIKTASAILKKKLPDEWNEVKAIGITYQMHGLVLVDEKQQVLRPSIIWCDSRAIEIGQKACQELGEQFCLSNFLNSPGNFTASKLRWVQENEPELYQRIHKIMLPGDYVAMKLSGFINTTVSGLSEGIMWNFTKGELAYDLLKHWDIDPSIIPERKDTFSIQATVSKEASDELGIQMGVPITYRAGDQPNNAFSLNVLNPGEIAATAGTSGVIYGITDEPVYDPKSRVNTFVHVNHSLNDPRYGILLCVNGTGILNSWMRKNLFNGSKMTYHQMNEMAAQIKPGAEGLLIYPFGNGAERSLLNSNPGACIRGLSFNSHDQRHLLKAGQEGIVFALNYGMDIMKEIGIRIYTVKAGNTNMFLSPVFQDAFVNTTEAQLILYDTDGASGAARGAAKGAGIYSTFEEAFSSLQKIEQKDPDPKLSSVYQEKYGLWKNHLKQFLEN
ncbi:MAG: FGGY family carbohydrate kinase [Balneolales bacterium]